MHGTIWEVVGGVQKGGILVREGRDKASAEIPERLATGSLVQQLDMFAERLQYQLLSGSGPIIGWVSVEVKGARLLVQAQKRPAPESLVPSSFIFLYLLRIVDDEMYVLAQNVLQKLSDTQKVEASNKLKENLWKEKDQKIVRKSIRALALLNNSNAVATALANSDFNIRCEALVNLAEFDEVSELILYDIVKVLLEDSHWRTRCWAARIITPKLFKVGGGATDAALAALRQALDDSDREVRDVAAQTLRLMWPESKPEPELPLYPSTLTFEPVVDRKIRILALHGTPSNSSIMKAQIMHLKGELGKDVEWNFIDSPLVWEPIPGSSDPLFAEPSDVEKRLANNKPFLWWYKHGNRVYSLVDEGVQFLRKCVKELQPDVLVSFSQGSNLISLTLDALRRDREPASWRLSVLFMGGQIDDGIYKFQEGWTSSQPTIRVFNAQPDAFFPQGEPSLQYMYPEIIEIGHEDGHVFPHSQPRAKEIYKTVADEIRQRCKTP